ncbi:hypothetical protein SDC9_148448 [bioreactor metagenome]|uniref:Uncharacterized protein n=1 Tax=bioreactor metagenome TaxID=1076179 RepID=A0A645EIZ0_9ZZZZ
MSDADVASGTEKIADIGAVQTTVGNAEWSIDRLVKRRLSIMKKSPRRMIINRPPSVGYNIGKWFSRFDIMLIKHIIAHITAAFPFPG